jgi:peroxiredoxin
MDHQHLTGPLLSDEPRIQPSADAIAVLDTMAARLTIARPQGVMDEGRRLAMVFRYANEQHPNDDHAADALEREVLTLAPRLDDREVTRGEYALLLRKVITAGGTL